MTFIGTLLSFAVILLLSIIGTVIASAVRGVHPDMRIAYRFAAPAAIVAGGIILVLSIVMEVRHYRQTKALAGIEKMG